MAVSEERMRELVGHAFPGGTYRIEHWENFLLTEATGFEPLPGGLVHPAHLFHVPIAGAGISIADLFALAQADSDASVTIDYYDWEVYAPLRESETYAMRGGVSEHERKQIEQGPLVDSLTFRIEVTDQADGAVACVTFRWHFWRFES
jgi:hypothetical protein